MDALFIELPAFQKHRDDYLDDDLFRSFQLELLKNPEAGDLIEGTGGLRKIRFCDQRRSKGKRSGLRVILLVVCFRPILAIHRIWQKRAGRPVAFPEKNLQTSTGC